jgi:Zn ribbon nucleic-acid-binding protein
LCPNCHKRFDTFARFVDENGQIVDTTTAKVCGHLRTHSDHHIEESNFDYHRRQARML